MMTLCWDTTGGGDRGGDEHGQADGEDGRGGERLPTVWPQQPPAPTQGSR